MSQILALIKLASLTEKIVASLISTAIIAIVVVFWRRFIRKPVEKFDEEWFSRTVRQVYLDAARDVCDYRRMNDNLLQGALEQAINFPSCWDNIISDGIGEKEERVSLAAEVFKRYLAARNCQGCPYRLIEEADDLCKLELLTYNRVIQAIDLLYEIVLEEFGKNQPLRARYEKWLHQHPDTTEEWKKVFNTQLLKQFTGELDYAMGALVDPRYKSLTSYLRVQYENDKEYTLQVVKSKEGWDVVYPLVAFPAKGELINKEIDQIIDFPEQQTLTPYIANDYYVGQMVNAGFLSLDNTINLETVAMKSLDCKRWPHRMECGMGTYFEILHTAGALEWELRTAGIDGHLGQETTPLRVAIHNRANDPVLDGRGRCTGVGASTMIAYPNPKDPDDWRFLFMQRGTRGTPLYRGRFHVVPSFMFQPCDVTGFDPNSLYYNILREFGEEVLDLDEERIRKEPNYLPAQPIFKDFRDDLDSGRIGIIYTGTTMNLLDLRPDICSVLVFTDYQLYEKRHGDWKITLTEFDPTEIGKQSGEKQRRYKYFSLKKAESDFVDLFPPHNITPPGAGAMWLAIQYLKDKRPEDIRELLQRKSIV